MSGGEEVGGDFKASRPGFPKKSTEVDFLRDEGFDLVFVDPVNPVYFLLFLAVLARLAVKLLSCDFLGVLGVLAAIFQLCLRANWDSHDWSR